MPLVSDIDDDGAGVRPAAAAARSLLNEAAETFIAFSDDDATISPTDRHLLVL